MTRYSACNLPSCSYCVVGLVKYESYGGHGDVQHDWTWLCTDPEKQWVLIKEVYDISWGNRDGCGPSCATARHLCEVTEEPLSAEKAEDYLKRLKCLCGRVLPLPFACQLPHEEKF